MELRKEPMSSTKWQMLLIAKPALPPLTPHFKIIKFAYSCVTVFCLRVCLPCLWRPEKAVILLGLVADRRFVSYPWALRPELESPVRTASAYHCAASPIPSNLTFVWGLFVCFEIESLCVA